MARNPALASFRSSVAFSNPTLSTTFPGMQSLVVGSGLKSRDFFLILHHLPNLHDLECGTIGLWMVCSVQMRAVLWRVDRATYNVWVFRTPFDPTRQSPTMSFNGCPTSKRSTSGNEYTRPWQGHWCCGVRNWRCLGRRMSPS